jgi:hypothetical protein
MIVGENVFGVTRLLRSLIQDNNSFAINTKVLWTYLAVEIIKSFAWVRHPVLQTRKSCRLI